MFELAAPSGGPTAAGAAIGATVGAVTAAAGGKSVAQPSIKEKPAGGMAKSFAGKLSRRAWGKMTGTGTRITIGPLGGENFPYILLDRAMAVVWYLACRAHAKRDAGRVNPGTLKNCLDGIKASTQYWPDELRKACRDYVQAVAKTNASAEQEARFQ